jgi:hypothetical protein
LLAAAALFLALSLDRLDPDPAPKPDVLLAGTAEAAVRAWPARNSGRFGKTGDPLGFAFEADERTLRAALRDAGWTEIPTSVRGSLAAGLDDLWDGRPLAAFPPMNDYRLDGRRQDMNWAIAVRPILERHHFRLWRTGQTDSRGRELWWGSGNYDLRVRWRDFSHVPDPDADRERDFIAGTLRGSPYLERAGLTDAPQVPREGANDKGYPFRTDGRAALIVLRAPGR